LPSPEPQPARERPRPHRLSQTGQRVFECLSLGLVVFDHQLEIIHHNPAAAFLVGSFSQVDEALAAGTVDSTYQDWRKALRDVIDYGRQCRFDQVLYRGAEGRELLLNLLCIALTESEGGPITGGTLVIEDVTVAASMEKRLAVSERMAAVGKLAARVAHELNNPLDGILRYLNLALRANELTASEKVTEYLQQARGGLMRMTEIVRELVEFSRSAYTAFDHAGINAIVEEAVKVMSDKAVAGEVSIICTLADGMPAVRGSSLFQVFCNMIKNAIDAMPTGGTLTISTHTADRDAVIRFEDTGIGLPREMERIFEPFFTTKEAGKGTGLGLAICRDIVEKYKGKITPERRTGGGTIFTIRIPLESCASIRNTVPLPQAVPRSAASGPAEGVS
jgi:signal transduction histidine kinase